MASAAAATPAAVESAAVEPAAVEPAKFEIVVPPPMADTGQFLKFVDADTEGAEEKEIEEEEEEEEEILPAYYSEGTRIPVFTPVGYRCSATATALVIFVCVCVCGSFGFRWWWHTPACCADPGNRQWTSSEASRSSSTTSTTTEWGRGLSRSSLRRNGMWIIQASPVSVVLRLLCVCDVADARSGTVH